MCLLLLCLTACGVEVTWLDADGTLIHEDTYWFGEEIPIQSLPEDTDIWHYLQWEKQASSDDKKVTYKASREEKTELVWLDADGTPLYSERIIKDAKLPEKPIPADTDAWHYTGWAKTEAGNKITFTAERLAKYYLTWVDADGSVLSSEMLLEGEDEPKKPLPADTDEWHYTEWKRAENGTSITFRAERVSVCRGTWLDADGTVLHTETVYGDTPLPQKALPADTTRWHYTEWEKISSTENAVTYRACRVAKMQVTWFDADGNVLHTDYVLDKSKIVQRDLPADTADWHYTGWKKSETDTLVTFVAEREVIWTVTWLDADGKVLYTEKVFGNAPIPQKPLPPSTDTWAYKEWKEVRQGNHCIYTAVRELKLSYLAANVFQIVVNDASGNPFSLGSAFVINEDGWFITNAHVVKDGSSAWAIFDIPDLAKGDDHTLLSITRGAYVNYGMDLFVGKIDGYAKISKYYKSVGFATSSSVGEKTYSVGYPNSSTFQEIHEGVVQEGYPYLVQQLPSGFTYVFNSSYTAHGSSGGVLLNEKMQVLGINSYGWTDNMGNFVIGAALASSNFLPLLSTLGDKDLVSFAIAVFRDMAAFAA